MLPILMTVLYLTLAFLPVPYLLFLFRHTLKTPSALEMPSARQALTTAALYLPTIGVNLLIGSYLVAGIQIVVVAVILIAGVVAHRTAPGTADDTTAADPHTK